MNINFFTLAAVCLQFDIYRYAEGNQEENVRCCFNARNVKYCYETNWKKIRRCVLCFHVFIYNCAAVSLQFCLLFRWQVHSFWWDVHYVFGYVHCGEIFHLTKKKSVIKKLKTKIYLSNKYSIDLIINLPALKIIGNSNWNSFEFHFKSAAPCGQFIIRTLFNSSVLYTCSLWKDLIFFIQFLEFSKWWPFKLTP